MKSKLWFFVVFMMAMLFSVSQVHAANVASGRSYTVSPGEDFVFGGSAPVVLTDGVYQLTNIDDSGLRWTNKSPVITVDLGSSVYVGSADLVYGVWTAAGIYAPTSVQVYLSADGVTYTSVGLVSAGTDINGVTKYMAVSFASQFARYVKYQINCVANDSLQVTELRVYSATDSTSPIVSVISPLDGAIGVSVGTVITATFSEPMDASTINTSTFLVSGVAGAVSYNSGNNTATFTPSANLAYETAYTVTITTGVTDTAGNAMAFNYSWSFTTAQVPDTTPPTVVAVSPLDGATGVAVGAVITATFSESMNSSTVNSSNMSMSGGVTGTLNYDSNSKTVTFTPAGNLAYETVYTVMITTGVTDTAGNAMVSNYSWSFTTVQAPDTTPPTVVGVSPLDGAVGVAVNNVITATFSESMDASTLNVTSVLVSGGVSGVVSYDFNLKMVTFTPSASLGYGVLYTVQITTDVKDLSGNAIVSGYTWSFTTAFEPPPEASSVGVVFGRVLDKYAKPFSGVLVQYGSNDYTYGGVNPVVTDIDGFYYFENCDTSYPFSLTISKPKYGTSTVSRDGTSISDRIQIADETLNRGNSAKFALSGTVRDTLQNPVDFVRVRVKGGGICKVVYTDLSGGYSFDNLLTGTYTVTARKQGFWTTSVKYYNGDAVSGVQDVVMKPK